MGVDAERMRKRTCTVFRAVFDIVRRGSAGGIQSGKLTNTLRHFVVSARGVAADAESADDLADLDVVINPLRFSKVRYSQAILPEVVEEYPCEATGVLDRLD